MKKSAISIVVDGTTIVAGAKDFATGSQGFYGNGKVVIDGAAYQVGINVTRIGSGDEPEAAARIKAVAAAKAEAAKSKGKKVA